jgi:hypothetical protein
MRITLACVLSLALASCGDDNTGGDQGTTQDLAGKDLAGRDLAMSTADLAGADLSMSTNDMAMSMGGDGPVNGDLGVGAMCNSACDCQAGLACFMGTCQMGFAPVYCCGSNDCPAGEFCQNPTGGMLHRCGGVGDGGFPGRDGGFDRDAFPDGGGFCQFVTCNSDNKCMNFGCGMCDQASHTCMP